MVKIRQLRWRPETIIFLVQTRPCVCLESSSSLSGIVREQTQQIEAQRAAQTKERRRKREGKNMKRELICFVDFFPLESARVESSPPSA